MALRVSTSTGTPSCSMRGVPSNDIVVRDKPSSPNDSATTNIMPPLSQHRNDFRMVRRFVTLSAFQHAPPFASACQHGGCAAFSARRLAKPGGLSGFQVLVFAEGESLIDESTIGARSMLPRRGEIVQGGSPFGTRDPSTAWRNEKAPGHHAWRLYFKGRVST